MLYLSVHDLTWLNSLVCGEQVPFDYELLEEAIAAQYGYGDSADVMGQGSDFAEALAFGKPFERGNLRTALPAVGIYLEGNGVPVRFDGDVAERVRALSARELTGGAFLESLSLPDDRSAGVPPATSVPSVPLSPAVRPASGAALRRSPTVAGSDQTVLSRSLVTAMVKRCRDALVTLEPWDRPTPGRVFDPYLHRD
ncbi:MAG: hypothetical protein FJX72_06160 [Armatimonadetes bacterium]|nr:hypothetical protein [Armatimonadota bacterium]